jgi:TonB family protein
MIRLTIVSLLFNLLPIISFAQEDSEEDIYSIVEKMPIFPGGEAALVNYVKENLHFPEYEKINGYSGKLFVTFVISSTGKVKNARIAREIPGCQACSEEALKVVLNMPEWRPGMNRGKNVAVQYNIPVHFENSIPTPGWHKPYLEGKRLLNHRQYAEALKLFEEALQSAPNQTEILLDRAIAKYNLKSTKEACREWEVVLKTATTDYHREEAERALKMHCAK